MRCASCERRFDWFRGAGPAAGAEAELDAPPALFHENELRDPFEPRATRAPAPAAEPGPGGGARALPGAGAGDASIPLESAIQELVAEDVTPALVARLAVEELANAGAAELLRAYDAGLLFARFGPELSAAWERCVARLGSAADPALFREALRSRLGIDLPEWSDS